MSRLLLALRRLGRWESGQALILGAAAIVPVIGFTALVIDVGMVLHDRRDAQNAADSGALAGAHVLIEGGWPAQAQAEAEEYAGRNGFDGGGGSTATANVPPTEGPYAGDTDCLEVVTSRDRAALFARVVGQADWTVTARAVACVETGQGAYALITLNETLCAATEVYGNGSITITGGGTFTNSECATEAFLARGNAEVDTEVNDVVGECREQGNAEIEVECTHAGHMEDPLADLPYPTAPTPPSAPVQSCPSLSGIGSYTFQPGVYNCTISPTGIWDITFAPGDYYVTGGFKFSGNTNITLGPGTYTLGGWGLNVTGNGQIIADGVDFYIQDGGVDIGANREISADDATFYIESGGIKVNGNADVSADGVTFYVEDGCIDMNGNADLVLSAPTSGTYEGILFFQNRSNSCEVKMNGNLGAGNWGTFYAAGAHIKLTGNGDTSYQFISDTFEAGGNGDVVIEFHDGVTAGAPSVRLTE